MIESGKKFGKYTLLKRLAVGGMAEIFKASAGGLDGFEKIVAIKRLHRQFSEDGDFATMLVDEAKLAVRLNHSNIGQVFDLGCIDGQYFIVMEYINGLDMHELAERIQEQNRKIPLDAVVHVVTCVAEALHYAHNKLGPDGMPLEIVHRDVSPQNIMISVEGEVKLVDFGIAKARMRVQHTQAGIIKGKFYYMSPEQALGNQVDARTDVYALGMVLYEILSGSHPFDRVPDADLLKSVRMADFAPIAHVVPDVPEELAKIIDLALMRNADRRYRSALQMKHALQEFSEQYLPSFSRMKMAGLVQKNSARHLPEETRAGGYEAMERQDYLTSGVHDSMIFDEREVDSEKFEEDGATRVFLRDSPEESFEPTREVVEEKVSAPKAPRKMRRSDPDVVQRAPEDLRKTAGSSVSLRGFGGEVPGIDEGPSPVRGTKIHERIKTGLATQFDYLLRRQPHMVGGVLALLAVLLLGMSAWMVLGSRGADESGAENWHTSIGDDDEVKGVEEITLAVSTSPPNAELYLNGVFSGQTPASLPSLNVGEGYVLRFERDGYDIRELTIMAEADMAPMVVRLEPLGGIVRVETTPVGVEIFLDGVSQGVTPLTMMGLERDLSHEVEARYSEEEAQRWTVSWDDGDERMQEINFEFEVEEEEVAVAPARTSRRSPTRRRTRDPAPAPRQQASNTNSAAGAGLDPFAVTQEMEQGLLTVRVRAEDARIYVDGNLVQDGTSLRGHALDAGSYDVRVYFPQLKRHSDTRAVVVRAGETSTVTISP